MLLTWCDGYGTKVDINTSSDREKRDGTDQVVDS